MYFEFKFALRDPVIPTFFFVFFAAALLWVIQWKFVFIVFFFHFAAFRIMCVLVVVALTHNINTAQFVLLCLFRARFNGTIMTIVCWMCLVDG